MKTCGLTNFATTDAPAVVVVLGMHRSGTSALAGCLRELGVPFGGPLLPANFANERGYFEHTAVVAEHDELLQRLGTTALDATSLPPGWADRPEAAESRKVLAGIAKRNLSRAPLWCIKDPRLCLLLPLWRPIFEELGVAARYLFILRSPWEVLCSLRDRDSLSWEESLELWHRHTTAADLETRAEARGVVTFEGLLASPVRELDRLERATGLRWPTAAAHASDALRRFLEPALRHHSRTPPPETVSPRLQQLVEGLWNGLARLADDDSPEARSLVDRFAAYSSEEISLLDRIQVARAASVEEYGVRWLEFECPAAFARGETAPARAAFQVVGTRPLSREGLFLAYHWVDARDPSRSVVREGLRTPVTSHVPAGASWSGPLTVQAPAAPGRYVLRIDLVRERVAWFSERGVVPISREVDIT